MSCGLPHVELDAAIASVKKGIEIGNREWPVSRERIRSTLGYLSIS